MSGRKDLPRGCAIGPWHGSDEASALATEHDGNHVSRWNVQHMMRLPISLFTLGGRRQLPRSSTRAMFVGLAAAFIAACGTTTAQRTEVSTSSSVATTSTSTPDPDALAALDAWSSFPLNATPRPLVLLAGSVLAPSGGFANTDDKEAFLSGAITTPAALPLGPDRADGYAIVGASDALTTLRATGTGNATHTLTTTAVRFGSGSFPTDRGSLELPAWLVSFAGVQNPAAVLAVDRAAQFIPPHPSDQPSQFGATTTLDAGKLVLHFVGAAPGTGPCTADYAAHVVEGATAVVVGIEAIRHETSGTGSCVAVGYSRETTITLSSPLGARVLVDEQTKSASAVRS
ncbi:MAG: putative secreted protein [Actinomycetia bacterium]|nr:putative secreted protein [Actinomycetes bacterium]